MIALGKAFLGQ